MLSDLSNFFSFLQKSPSVQHAAFNITQLLEDSSFVKIISENWEEVSNKKSIPEKGFFTHQNSVIAWKTPKTIKNSTQIRITTAHIDFPCLKIRQNHSSSEYFHNFLQIVPYGSPVSKSFVDIPLAIAGEVFYKCENKILSKLFYSQFPVAIIPNLAIHLSLNQDPSPESFWKAIYCENNNFLDFLSQQTQITPDKILQYQLNLYDPRPPIQFPSQWMQAPHLDDLSMVYQSLAAFLSIDQTDFLQIVAFFDHEEIGSTTSSGADSSFFIKIVETLTQKNILSLINQLQIISLDVAHGLHPLFPEKHSLENPPILGKGPCLKIDTNMRYANDIFLSSQIRSICKTKNIPIQIYEPKSGKPCGSTIGPIISSKLSASCIDMGIPILGMHANQEIGSLIDMDHIKNLLVEFFKQ